MPASSSQNSDAESNPLTSLLADGMLLLLTEFFSKLGKKKQAYMASCRSFIEVSSEKDRIHGQLRSELIRCYTDFRKFRD